jgi:hypothetical protein
VAIEIVQAVRQAEQDAERVEKEASLKAEAIVQKANEDAKALLLSMTKETLGNSEKDLKQAKLKGAELLVFAAQKSEKEIHLLKEMVKSKEQSAIDLVLSEVI